LKGEQTMLKPKQQRAIGLLAMGYDVFQVARLCDCDRATVYRWQQLDEFKHARDRHIQEMMTAMHPQIQATAREFIEGNLDAVRVLRQLVLDPSTPPAVRRAACNDLARHSGRWYDLMGFNAKLEQSKKLAVDEPSDPRAETVPDVPCRPSDDELEAAAEAERRAAVEAERLKQGEEDFSPRRSRESGENGTENGMEVTENIARTQRAEALQAEPLREDENESETASETAKEPEPELAGASGHNSVGTGMCTNGSAKAQTNGAASLVDTKV
jgi:hypothetical protein